MQVAELEDSKEKLDHLVSELRSRISDLQDQGPKVGSEVAELRIKELQQKLDLEGTTKRRLEVSGCVWWVCPGMFCALYVVICGR